MSMTNAIATGVVGLTLLIAAGCATTDVAAVKAGAGSGFLGRDSALLSPGEVAKGQAGLVRQWPNARRRNDP